MPAAWVVISRMPRVGAIHVFYSVEPFIAHKIIRIVIVKLSGEMIEASIPENPDTWEVESIKIRNGTK